VQTVQERQTLIKTRFISIMILASLLLSACSAPLNVASTAASALRSAASTLAQEAEAPKAEQPAPVQQATPAPVQAPSNAGEILSAYQGVLENIYTQVNPSVVSIRVLTPVTGAMSSGQGGLPFDMPGLPSLPGFGDGQQTPGLPSTPQYGEGAGSGFVWDAEGHIVTNNHVIDGAEKVEVTFYDGTSVEAEVIGRDADADLAVLKVDARTDLLKPITLSDSTQARVGQLAIAIGNPFGLENTMTVGIVSALGRTVPAGSGAGGRYSMSDVIQTDAPINPGNSGGVLVDDQGQVLGVTFAIESPVQANSGVGFVIPAAIVERVVPSLIETGGFEHPYLGVSAGTLTSALAEQMDLDPDQRGVLVSEVVDGGPADQAGLRGSDRQATIDGQQLPVGGDVITAIDGQAVKSMDELISYLSNNTKVGQAITLSILRDGQPQELKATLAARPSETARVEETQRSTTPSATGAWLGIDAVSLDAALAKATNLDADQQGVLVVDVAQDGPADQAGLRGGSQSVEVNGRQAIIGGDVITAIDGDAIATLEDLVGWLNQAKPGQQVALTILRGGRQMELSATLGERPA
jgi:S1-C subfamily serine protease